MNLVMAGLFLLCVALQVNDPDPQRWIALYALAVLNCGLSHYGRLPRWAALGLGLVCLVWAGVIWVRVSGQVTASELVASFGMPNLAVEEARETVGLILIASWMAVLTCSPSRKNSPPPN